MRHLVGRLERRWQRSPRVRQIAHTLGANVFLQLCLFASGIAIARGLGPKGRGEVTIILALPPVVMQLVCVGFPSALTYYVARQPGAWRILARRVAGAALIQMGVGLVLLVALDAYFLAGKPASAHDAAFVVLPSLPLLIFLYYVVHLAQGLGDIRWFNVLRVGSVALYSGGIAVVAVLGLTVMLAAIVWTTSQLLLAGMAIVGLARRARRQVPDLPGGTEIATSRTIARFALAGFLAQIAPIESFRLDTLAVAALFPSQTVGYYAVANSVSNPPLFTADALVAVGYPHIAAQSGQAAIASTKRYVRAGYVLCGGAAVLLIATLPILIPFLFGQAFQPAVGTGQLLACAAAVLGVRRIGNDCLRALGKPALATRLEVVTLAAFVLGVAIFGHLGSGRGVAVVLIVSASLGLLLFWRLLRRLEARRQGHDIQTEGA